MTLAQPSKARATFYAIVEPVWKSWGKDEKGRPVLEGAKVTRITQKKPAGKTAAGSIVTQLTLEFDAAAFLPLQPEAVVKISADQFELVTVQADAPEYDSSLDASD